MVSDLNKFIAKSVDELSNKFSSRKDLLEIVGVLLLLRRMLYTKANVLTSEKYNDFAGLVRDSLPEAYKRLESMYPILKELDLRWLFSFDRDADVLEITNLLEYIHQRCQEDSTDYVSDEVDAEVFDLLYAKTQYVKDKQCLRTPRQIIKLMVALIEPNTNESVLDTTFNSGYFLLEAYKRIQYTLLPNPEVVEKDADGFPSVPNTKDNIHLFDQQNNTYLEGVEKNEDYYRLGILNIALHGLSSVKYVKKDFFDFCRQEESLFDIVLANPPFGSRKNTSFESSIRDVRFETQYMDIQFLVRILQFLKPGGRACIIVPESSLTKTVRDYVYYRRLLLEEYALEAVISLPAGTFSPVTNAKASILVVHRTKSVERVWFYELENIGYSLDRNKRRTKGLPLQDCLKRFSDRHNARPNGDQKLGFFVDKEAIQKNNWVLAVKRYKKPEYEPIEQVDPQKLLAELMREQQEIDSSLNVLKELLR